MGAVNGNVYCSERIEIHPQARISGDVHYKLIELAPGAAINGKLTRETAEIIEDDVMTALKAVASDSRTNKTKKQKQSNQEATTA
jgi:cytoskeletal protein CcmA (bactofilin family)